jgi:hypothetical protein
VSKYHAKPQVVDGIRFASQKEARRYVELKLLDKAGVIDGLILQPRFELCTWHGDHSRAPFVGVYVADFEYFEKGKRVVEDVKGFKTPLYKWKKKHVEAQYGIRIVEI